MDRGRLKRGGRYRGSSSYVSAHGQELAIGIGPRLHMLQNHLVCDSSGGISVASVAPPTLIYIAVLHTPHGQVSEAWERFSKHPPSEAGAAGHGRRPSNAEAPAGLALRACATNGVNSVARIGTCTQATLLALCCPLGLMFHHP